MVSGDGPGATFTKWKLKKVHTIPQKARPIFFWAKPHHHSINPISSVPSGKSVMFLDMASFVHSHN